MRGRGDFFREELTLDLEEWVEQLANVFSSSQNEITVTLVQK